MKKMILAAAVTGALAAGGATAHAAPYPPAQDSEAPTVFSSASLVSESAPLPAAEPTAAPLPQAGSDVRDVVLAGAAAVAGGLALVVVGHRRRSHAAA